MTTTLEQVYSAALALPADSRAMLAQLLQGSLVDDSPNLGTGGTLEGSGGEDMDSLAEKMTEHFHRAKQAALQRREIEQEHQGSETPGR